ncbi:MAG: hypothetical protein L3J74_10355 [Bacteroidales bacterium]|nr:hypothetical protein [Bacteroidales bacterium]
MKLLKRILIIGFFLLIIIFIVGYVFVNHISTKALPDYGTAIQLKGLKEKVTV